MIINYKECEMDTPISYKSNPKRSGSKAYSRYEKYSKSKTLEDYFKVCKSNKFNSHMRADLRYDEDKGYLVIGSNKVDEKIKPVKKVEAVKKVNK